MGLDQSIYRRRAGEDPKEEIYWRKVNFVHRYFTNDWYERGYESDNLTEFPVTEGDLIALADKCWVVLNDKNSAPKLLPTMSGFFFGSTNYDDWYFHDVEYTKQEVERLLSEFPLDEDEELFYSAWY